MLLGFKDKEKTENSGYVEWMSVKTYELQIIRLDSLTRPLPCSKWTHLKQSCDLSTAQIDGQYKILLTVVTYYNQHKHILFYLKLLI